jgi:hypothetical protein
MRGWPAGIDAAVISVVLDRTVNATRGQIRRQINGVATIGVERRELGVPGKADVGNVRRSIGACGIGLWLHAQSPVLALASVRQGVGSIS